MPTNRRKARMFALQCQYAFAMSDNSMEQIIIDQLRERNEPEDVRLFAEALLKKTYSNVKEIDEMIKKRCRNWNFDRIALIDKLILRQSIAEFLYFEDIPPKVSIDEALELSKDFSTDKSSKFINGVLNAVAHDKDAIKSSS